MASINSGRVVLGGIGAGLVINVVESIMNLFVITGPMDEMLASLGLPPMGGGAIGGAPLFALTRRWRSSSRSAASARRSAVRLWRSAHAPACAIVAA
ncbi:MAG TPA: hypothetical protein EYQ27_00430 [Gemmatimonadetes bacterium]|nr:hypothetical protein [Gemmatimonadota bacterium]